MTTMEKIKKQSTFGKNAKKKKEKKEKKRKERRRDKENGRDELTVTVYRITNYPATIYRASTYNNIFPSLKTIHEHFNSFLSHYYTFNISHIYIHTNTRKTSAIEYLTNCRKSIDNVTTSVRVSVGNHGNWEARHRPSHYLFNSRSSVCLVSCSHCKSAFKA